MERLRQMIDTIGGRKYALSIFTLTLMFSFGIFCVVMGVDLTGAAAFSAVGVAQTYAYLRENVKQKQNERG